MRVYGDVVHVGEREAGLADFDDGLLSRENDGVHGSLGITEPTVDGERAGDVRRHVSDFSCRIDQEEVTVVQQSVVLDVVQNAGVVTRGDDGRVPLTDGPGSAEDVLHRRLHIVLRTAGSGEADRLGVTLRRDAARFAQCLNLLG